MNLLYLSHRIPYPPNKGDKIRSFNQIKYLSEAGYDIHLVCLADQQIDLDYQSKLLNWCKSVHLKYRPKIKAKLLTLPWIFSSLPLSVPYFYSHRLQKEVDRLLEEFDIQIVICFSSVMAEYLLCSSTSALNEKRLILDYCDLDSDKWKQYSQRAGFPMSWIYRREGSALLKYEQALNRFFDLSIFVSQAEAELFKPLAQNPARIRVVQNGVDHQFFSPSHHLPTSSLSSPNNPTNSINSNNSISLLFTGAMDYQANVDGILWFCRNVWPGLKSKIPDVKLYIVGANPVAEVRQLAGDDVLVTGYVQDIRDYYRLADICVIPLRLARGVQNKALEAMAMSKPVVTTSKVMQGIQARPDQDLLLADSPSEFEQQIYRLTQDQDLAQDLGRRGREFVLQNYDWQNNLKKLVGLLDNRHDQVESRPQQERGKVNPGLFLIFVIFFLLSSLWPMELTSPGASILYKIDPSLQNFLHLPFYTIFGWLFVDFLKHYYLSQRLRYIIFAALGLGFCFFLEVLQILIPGRYASLNDILFNLSGLILGFGLYLSLKIIRQD